MVKINTFTKADGTETKTIKLSGCGEEEEIHLRLMSDELFKKEYPAGTSKAGKAYEAFTVYGIGAIYTKNGEEHNVWVNLTETQGKKLNKLGLKKGLEIIAFLNGKYLDFKIKNSVTKPKPTLLNINTEAPEITVFEQDLITACKENNLNIEEIQAQFEGFKKQGKDILGTDLERIQKLVLKY